MMRALAKLSTLPPPWPGLLLFKLAWLTLVLGQQRWQWLVLAVVLPLQVLCLRRDAAAGSWWRAVPVALLGVAIDQLLCVWGVLQFPQSRVPAWLVVLWGSFALGLLQAAPLLRRLHFRVLPLVGASAGALAYFAGNRLGAVTFGVGMLQALTALACVWAVLLPLSLFMLTRKFTQLPWAVLMLVVVAMPARVGAESAWRVIGEGEYRRFLFSIYHATLESPAADFRFPGSAPLRLTLRYHHNVKPQQIVDATREQWQRQGARFDERWLQRLQQCLPAITKGDRLGLLVEADSKAELNFNDNTVCRFDDRDFIAAFVGIWLGENTTEPALRAALLGRKT